MKKSEINVGKIEVSCNQSKTAWTVPAALLDHG